MRSLQQSGTLQTPAENGVYARVYTPEGYGAAGNGTTDDTAAVQAMFNAAPAGARIHLSKTYFIPGGVTVTKQVMIAGTGTATKRSASSAASPQTVSRSRR